MDKAIEFIEVRQKRDDAIHEISHRIQARRLSDGRVELLLDESSLKKYNPGAKTPRRHTASIILTLTPENAAKLAPVFTEASS